MKILKYILITLGVLLVIFLALGFITPTVKYGNEIEINKPLKETWAVNTDETRMGEWLEGFESIELTSGERNQVGSEYLIKMTHNGENFEMKETITAWDEFERFGFTFDNDFMVSNLEVNFSEVDGKTIIKTAAEAEGKGMFAKSMMALSKGAMNDQDMKNLTALKKLVEENTVDYFPAPVDTVSVDSTSMEQ